MKTTGIKENLANIADQTHDLAETAYKLAVIEATDQLTKVASITIIISVLLLLMNFLLLFLGFGVARWIGDSMEDVKMGFFIENCRLFRNDLKDRHNILLLKHKKGY